LRAVKDRRQVRGRIVCGAVRLADDERLGLEPRMLGMKDDEGSLALHRKSCGGEFPIDRLNLVVVKTLAQMMVEMNPELVVDPLKGPQARVREPGPQCGVLRIAPLQLDEFAAGF